MGPEMASDVKKTVLDWVASTRSQRDRDQGHLRGCHARFQIAYLTKISMISTAVSPPL